MRFCFGSWHRVDLDIDVPCLSGSLFGRGRNPKLCHVAFEQLCSPADMTALIGFHA